MLPSQKLTSDQQAFQALYKNTGAIAYRGIRLPNGYGQILPTWRSYVDDRKTIGNRGQMVTVSGPNRGADHLRKIKTVLRYAIAPAVAAPRQLYPDGQYKEDDEIVVMSFRIFAKHILWNPTPEVIEHVVLRDDLNLRTLKEYKEERMTLSEARKRCGLS